MIPSQLLADHQIRYQREIDAVKQKMKDLSIEPQSNILIYSEYPDGWYATVGADDDFIYIFKFRPDKGVYLEDTEPAVGFLPNGTFIRYPWKVHLLHALCAGDEVSINWFAICYFYNEEDQKINSQKIREFEEFAHCEINPAGIRNGDDIWTIVFEGNTYIWGDWDF